MCWNINGWTDNNKILREKIIDHLHPDILCLGEMHLENEQSIKINNYVFEHFHRQCKHNKAPKTHGGVGILTKEELYNTFKIKVIDKCVEGILGVQFTHKDIGSNFIVYACYLAPVNSPFRRNQTFWPFDSTNVSP
jgi:exonuclease III